jgi:hypothetical protein
MVADTAKVRLGQRRTSEFEVECAKGAIDRIAAQTTRAKNDLLMVVGCMSGYG